MRKKRFRVAVIGKGGREHALAWKISQSALLYRQYVIPGNGGTATLPRTENIALDPHDLPAVVSFCQQNAVRLVIIGPEAPLFAGLADALRASGVAVFGPNKAAAEIERSKAHAKRLMYDSGVPTAVYNSFTDYERALFCVRGSTPNIVVKASGPAEGKGSFVCSSHEEAEAALIQLMKERVFKSAGDEVVIEERLHGRELSLHVVTDGSTSLVLPVVQDHKRQLDGDKGLNTGGMGAVGPLPWVSDALIQQAQEYIINRTLDGLRREQTPFTGCLYPGLMLEPTGELKVIEINCRFGDPETQVIMMLLQSDWLGLLYEAAAGNLKEVKPAWRNDFAACVVLASAGYPGKYETGFPISGIAEAEGCLQGQGMVFHAGTRLENGQLVTAGGRVLGVTAVGHTLVAAINLAYQAANLIRFQGKYMRLDIGSRALAMVQGVAAGA